MTRLEKIQFLLSTGLKAVVAVLALLNLWHRNDFFFVASLLVLFLMFLPALIERRWHIAFPPEIDLMVAILLCLHYVLGEYGDFYERFFWWDIFLHGINSLIFGFIGFIFAYALLLTERIQTKPLFVSMFAVFFAVFVGVVWELTEFAMDQAFGFNMQKSGLMDTMADLITDTLGAMLVGAIGFVYLKQPEPQLLNNLLARLAYYYRRQHLDEK